MDLSERIRDLEERLNLYRRIIREDIFSFGKKNSKTIPITELESNLNYLARAAELREKKLAYRKIGEMLGFQSTSILKWLKKGVLPGKLHVLYKIKQVPREYSIELAYALGVHTAAHNADSNWPVIWYNYRNNRILKKLNRCFDKLWPGRYKRFKNGGLGLSSRDIVRHIYYITRHNNSVPWEHLGTKEEKLEYLRGVFDLRGMATKKGGFSFMLTKTSKKLLQEVRVMLAGFGILGTIKETPGKYCLTIYDSELKKLVNLGVLPEPKLKILSGLDAEPKDHVRMYYTAWLLKNVYSPKEIAEKIGATKRIVADWLNPRRSTKNSKPRKRELPKIIKRYHDIEHFKSMCLFDPDAASLLYRSSNIDSDSAREIASVFDIDDITYAFPKGVLPESISETTEQLLYIKKEELRDYRDVSSYVLRDVKGTLYDKVKKLNEMFCEEKRACKYFAQALSDDTQVPFQIIYEWLTEKKTAQDKFF